MTKGKGKVVPLIFFLTDHYDMEAYWGSGDITARLLDLSTR
jgi:hypothetical protein